jgi:hypothetical protein
MSFGEWTHEKLTAAEEACIDAYETDLIRLDRREKLSQFGHSILVSMAHASPIVMAWGLVDDERMLRQQDY